MFSEDTLLTLAKRGCYLEYDPFGVETSHFQVSNNAIVGGCCTLMLFAIGSKIMPVPTPHAEWLQKVLCRMPLARFTDFNCLLPNTLLLFIQDPIIMHSIHLEVCCCVSEAVS